MINNSFPSSHKLLCVGLQQHLDSKIFTPKMPGFHGYVIQSNQKYLRSQITLFPQLSMLGVLKTLVLRGNMWKVYADDALCKPM